MQALLGQKKNQTQKFLSDGRRIPVTEVIVGDNAVVSIKTQEKNGYTSVQLGYGTKKKPTKAMLGHIKGANLEKAPLFVREIRIIDTNEELPAAGTIVKLTDVFKPGDLISVTGTSKGKGFAGGVKRYHFRGGPATHGQSDRHRAPGSIGSGTTPGRVYKGKRMAGKMGNETVTVKNLKVVGIDGETLLIEGVVPGVRKGFLVIKKLGEEKNFIPLLEIQSTVAAPDVAVEDDKEVIAEVESVATETAEA
ncbi:MAG TPA: 50S ribosomal protein L3 [Candidatus Saccharimonadales bacterium]|nr:50S ribosomal protein L3 [Candidatus Saccharimonadales bacterium]